LSSEVRASEQTSCHDAAPSATAAASNGPHCFAVAAMDAATDLEIEIVETHRF
jgi:hypothetical protein